MYYLSGLFCEKTHKPLFVCVFDDESRKVDFYPIYLPGTKLTLFEANQNIQIIKELIENHPVVVPEFKNFIKGLKLDLFHDYQVYDVNGDKVYKAGYPEIQKQALAIIQDMQKIELMEWQKVLANSKLVYSYLEDAGFVLNWEPCHPIYELAYSGRSRCLGHNIQGTNEEDVVHLPEEHDTFLHFDWIAADLRVASLISQDEYLMSSFGKSDPYTVMSEDLNLPREECKIEMLKCLYSLNVDSPVLELYPKLQAWMKEEYNRVIATESASSFLGREFKLEEGRSNKSVFNAIIQGSVAHAMQAAIYKIFRLYPDNLIAEVHDSLIMSCESKKMNRIAGDVIRIMREPLKGISEDNPRFPLKLSIGPKWKQWKLYKEFR